MRYTACLAALLVAVAPAHSRVTGTEHSPLRTSVSGMSLLGTIPAVPDRSRRVGYLLQCQCAAGMVVEMSDSRGVPSVVVLEQGGSLSFEGVPYEGAFRVFSTDPACRYSAWVSDP